MREQMNSAGNAFCPECHMPGMGVHYAGCSLVRVCDVEARLTPADVRRIVREELARLSPYLILNGSSDDMSTNAHPIPQERVTP